MSFRTRRVLFSTPFYVLFQFFLIKYLLLLICPVSDAYVGLAAVLIGMNRVIPMFFEARKSRRIFRFLTTLDGVWMWMSLFFLMDILAIYLIATFVSLSWEIILILLVIVPVLGLYNYYKAHKLVVNERVIELDNLSRDINIVHLSDVHFGSVRHRQIIRQISDELCRLDESCDLAIISGDLADGSSVVEEDDFMDLSDVEMPIIFTPGNHDFYPGIDDVLTACRKAGIIVLDNESMEFEGLNIFGIGFSLEDRDFPVIDGQPVKRNRVNIINYHVPYYWSEFCDLGFDIQLSGHTHGGQFYPAINFTGLMFEYNRGLFDNGEGKYLHVTTGVGSMDTPMRWGTDSELVILKLQKKL